MDKKKEKLLRELASVMDTHRDERAISVEIYRCADRLRLLLEGENEREVSKK